MSIITIQWSRRHLIGRNGKANIKDYPAPGRISRNVHISGNLKSVQTTAKEREKIKECIIEEKKGITVYKIELAEKEES